MDTIYEVFSDYASSHILDLLLANAIGVSGFYHMAGFPCWFRRYVGDSITLHVCSAVGHWDTAHGGTILNVRMDADCSSLAS